MENINEPKQNSASLISNNGGVVKVQNNFNWANVFTGLKVSFYFIFIGLYIYFVYSSIAYHLDFLSCVQHIAPYYGSSGCWNVDFNPDIAAVIGIVTMVVAMTENLKKFLMIFGVLIATGLTTLYYSIPASIFFVPLVVLALLKISYQLYISYYKKHK